MGNKVMFGWMWSGGGMCVAVGWGRVIISGCLSVSVEWMGPWVGVVCMHAGMTWGKLLWCACDWGEVLCSWSVALQLLQPEVR